MPVRIWTRLESSSEPPRTHSGSETACQRLGTPSMPASERRIVHEHLRDHGGVATHSEGDEPDRYLVVSLGDG